MQDSATVIVSAPDRSTDAGGVRYEARARARVHMGLCSGLVCGRPMPAIGRRPSGYVTDMSLLSSVTT